MTASSWIIFVPLLIFLLILLFITRSVTAHNGTDFVKNYFLGDRALQGFVLAMTLVATYGSVSSFVSGPGLAWRYGLGWVVFAAPQIITGFLVLGVLGKKLSLVSRRIGAITVIDVIVARFKSSALGAFLSVALLFFFIAMMVGQFIGGAQLISQAADIHYVAGLALFGSVVVFYTTFGGFRAVAITDTVCAVLMLTGMGVLAAGIVGEAGGLNSLMQKIAADAGAQQAEAFLDPTSCGALPWTLLFSSWILVGFATVALPQSAVRCMAYKSTQDLHLAMVVSTIVCGALMIGMTLLGFFARALVPESEAFGGNTDAMIPYLIVHHMNPWVAGITLVAPVAATMSTVSSLLIAASSAIIKDLILRRYTMLPDRATHVARYAKFCTCLIGMLALILAIYPFEIIVWINMFAFGGLEIAFLCPLVGGLFWSRATLKGAWTSVLVGLAIYGWACLFKPDLGGWHAVSPALAVSIISFVLVSLTEERRINRDFFPQ